MMPQTPATDTPAMHQGAIGLRPLALQIQILQSTTARQITHTTERSQGKTHMPRVLVPLDMTQLKWMDGFRAESSPYTQSDVVQPLDGHAKRSVYTLTFLPSFDDCSVG